MVNLILLIALIVVLFTVVTPAAALHALAAGTLASSVNSWSFVLVWTVPGLVISWIIAWKRETSPQVPGEAKPLRALALGSSGYAALVLIAALAVGAHDLVTGGDLATHGKWYMCCLGAVGLVVFAMTALRIVSESEEQEEMEEEGEAKQSHLMNSAMQTILEECGSRIENNHIFFAPNLPPKKVKSALMSYAFTAKDEQVLALVDNTVIGSAREGILLTDKGIYTSCGTMETAKNIRLGDVQSVALTEGFTPKLRINDIEFLTFTIGEKEAPRLFAEMLEKISEAFSTEVDEPFTTEQCGPRGVEESPVREQPTIPEVRTGSTVRDIVQQYRSAIVDDHIFFAPNLPPKKVGNALRSYASPAIDEDLLVLIDDTVLGSAKVGVLLTDKSVYSHIQMESPQCLDLRSVRSVAFNKGLLYSTIRINDQTFAKCDTPSKEAMRLFAEMLEKISETFDAENVDETFTTEQSDPREAGKSPVGEQRIAALRWVSKGTLPLKLGKSYGAKYSGSAPYSPPALAVFGHMLHVVRRGPGTELLHSTFDGSQWSPDKKIRYQESSFAPILAPVGDVLHMVHMGKGWGSDIWHSTYDGVSWSHNEKIPGQEVRATPALAGVGDVLHMLYLGPKGYIYHSTCAGQEWSVGVPLNKASKYCPNLAVFKDVLHMLHVAGSDDSIWCSTFDGQQWSPSMKIPEQRSKVSPIVVAFLGGLHMFCRGSWGHLYHLIYDGHRWSSSVRERILEKPAGAHLAMAAGRDVLHVMATKDVSNTIWYFQGIGETE